MPLATYDDARAEFARNAGSDRPDSEWILTPFDTWERNPAYCGPKGRHPEDDYDENGPTTPTSASERPGRTSMPTSVAPSSTTTTCLSETRRTS